MHYDVVIIGAGMSGLAAGIRLAYYDYRVCVVERHHAVGGLNSYYKRGGREFDVGLHALTNFVPAGKRQTPLAKLLRQLRLSRNELDLAEQRYSEVSFPGRRLRFTNDIAVLTAQVAEEFPQEIDRFRRFLADVAEFEDTRLDQPHHSARSAMRESLHDPQLIEMLLCPVMYYGNAEEHDMDFTQFVTMFKSLFFEGFARPRGGVRAIIRALVKKYRSCKGELRIGDGVAGLEIRNNRVAGLTLDSGEQLTADIVISSAGHYETMQICQENGVTPDLPDTGAVSFVETICILDRTPADLGHEAAIVFFNDSEKFHYARPREPVDLRSGVLCCPNNYDRHKHLAEGIVRLTWLADFAPWMDADADTYVAMKQACFAKAIERAEAYLPRFREHVVDWDMFTPRTIERFTGHISGAVYGSPRKIRDGRTQYENLFICGTDQGFLGIIGAMLSGITVANLHVLSDS